MNYYLILGIESNASEDEIKEAYRKKVQQFHPDHYGDDSSPFLKIQEAYQILSNPVRRRRYDNRLAQAKSPVSEIKYRTMKGYSAEPEPLIPSKKTKRRDHISLTNSFETYAPSFEELFDRLWKNFSIADRPKSERIENLKVHVEISPQQAEKGGQLQLMIPSRIKCSFCHGTGRTAFWDCLKCYGLGIVAVKLPLLITYPGGIQNQFNKSVSLSRYGIHNFYLTISINVSKQQR